MKFYDTLIPYHTMEHKGIQYTVCKDFRHISRYKGLRQVVHGPTETDRFITLETPNTFATSLTHKKFRTYRNSTSDKDEIVYHEVTAQEENRLDLIAQKYLGASTYSWVIAYFNHIEDGFTIREGQRLAIPKAISLLFRSGELLGAISPLTLNLGSE